MKMKVKNIVLAIAAVGVLTVGIVACEKTNASSNAASAASTPTVAVSTATDTATVAAATETTAAPAAAPAVTVAVLNMSDAGKSSKMRAKAAQIKADILKKFPLADLQAKLQVQQKEIQAMLVAQQSASSKVIKEENKKKIDALMVQYQADGNAFMKMKSDAEQYSNQQSKDLVQEIVQVAGNIAKSKGYNLVLPSDVIIYSSAPVVDITNDVKAVLNQ